MRIHQCLFNAATFRRVFDFGEREVANWFPGHMAKGACDSIIKHQTEVNLQ